MTSSDRADRLDALLSRTGTGDHGAYTELFDAVAPAVLGMIRRVLRDQAMAEEVAQDVLLEVWRKSPIYRADRGRATSWIFTIAHRRAIDRVRSEQSARDRMQRAGRLEPDPPPDAVAGTVLETFEHSRIKRALASLTDLQREALELAFYQGLTHRQVAEHLDVPLGTVKSRMRDGLSTLRRVYEEST